MENPEKSVNKLWLIAIPDPIFSDRIKASSPNISNCKINEIINPFERKYQYLCGSIEPGDSIGRALVLEKNNLSIFEELKIISDQEKIRLKEIRSQFNLIVQKIISEVGGEAEEVERNLDLTLGPRTAAANSLSESKEILTNGPLIRGFEKTNDPKISNDKVLKFVKDTFGIEALIKSKIGMISKDDEWSFYLSEDKQQIGKEIIKLNMARMTRPNILIAKNKEDYLSSAMLLEGVNSPKLLKHIYKLRAEAGDSGSFSNFLLNSVGVEKSSDFDYLQDIELKTESDKMRAYILGTVAHEILHRYIYNTSRDCMEKYKIIVNEEESSKRKHFVSDYVIKHQEIYGNGESVILEEDLAEAVRIYTINSLYLQKNYPRRLVFIEKYLPFIKKDVAIKIIAQVV